MNLPNRLTLIRIILVPVFMLFSITLPESVGALFPGDWLINLIRAINAFIEESGIYVAGVVFVVAFATDALDGFIARKYNLVTNFGAFLDPIADKLLVTAALIVLTARGTIGAWIPVIIISREFLITGLRLLAANKGIVMSAGGFGKVKTISQSIALTMLLFQNFNVGILNAVNAGLLLLYLAVALTILSGADYIIKNYELLK